MKRDGDSKLMKASDSVASSSALNVRNNAPAEPQKKVTAHSNTNDQTSGAQHGNGSLSPHTNSKNDLKGGQ